MSNAALHITTSGELAVRQAGVMLALCEANAWRVISMSKSIPALAALVAIGAVDVVVLARRDRDAVRTIELAGGRVAILRESQRPAAAGGAELADTIAALVAAGRLSSADAATLMDAAGTSAVERPATERRPRRIA